MQLPHIARLYFIVIVTLMTTACTSLLFHPTHVFPITPQRLNLTYEDVFITMPDQTQLHGWFLPAEKQAKATVLFLHGNAQNISNHLASVHWMPRYQINVFLLDYRGYGRSKGKPDLKNIVEDTNVVIEHLLQQPESRNNLVVFGQSLGGAIAINALAQSPYKDKIHGLIVEGAFSDIRLIAREKLAGFWLTWPFQWPLSYLMNGNYDPIDTIADIAPTPLLIAHGKKDSIVPIHHGQALFQAASAPKEFWQFDDAKHIDAFIDETARLKLSQYIENLIPKIPISAPQ